VHSRIGRVRVSAGIALTLAALLGAAACGGRFSGGASGSGGSGQKYVISFAGINTNASTQGVAQANFSSIIEKSTKNQIQVHDTYNSALGTTNSILQEVSTGALQMSATSPSDLSAFCPSLNMLSLPFLFSSLDQARAAMAGAGGKELFAKCDNSSLTYFPVQEYGMDAILGKQTLASVAAFKGLKIRTIPGDIAAKTMSAVGASPVSLSFSDVPTALTTNEINGTVNSIQNSYSSGLYKLAKKLTTSTFLYSPGVVVVNTKFLNSLPGDLKQDLISAIEQSGKAQVTANGKATNDDLAKMQASGVQVTALPDAEAAKWKQAAQGLYTSVGQQYGANILADLQR
jgi:TRAP-type C4-dicarboxylate transport system substrate-binding protein